MGDQVKPAAGRKRKAKPEEPGDMKVEVTFLRDAQKTKLAESIHSEMETKIVAKAKKKASAIAKFNRGKAVKTQKKAVSSFLSRFELIFRRNGLAGRRGTRSARSWATRRRPSNSPRPSRTPERPM